MSQRRTMSEEMDRWLEQRMTRVDVVPMLPTEPIPRPVKKGEPVPPCPLNEAQFAWLWKRYVRCSFPVASAPKRLARTPLENLTLRGRNFAVRMAYRFRRQIFGKVSAKWAQDEFLSAVRIHSSNDRSTDPSSTHQVVARRAQRARRV